MTDVCQLICAGKKSSHVLLLLYYYNNDTHHPSHVTVVSETRWKGGPNSTMWQDFSHTGCSPPSHRQDQFITAQWEHLEHEVPCCGAMSGAPSWQEVG